MKYTVRTPEGELVFGSFGEIELAWHNGLVGPEDEILEEGHTQWRKAKSFPVLARARRTENQIWEGTQMGWVTIVVVLASISLYLLAKGRYIGVLPALLLCLLLTRITVRAFKRRKPHA